MSSSPLNTPRPPTQSFDGAHAPFAPRAAHATGAQRRRILATASAICALIVLDTNVVAVSLPSIATTFHASFADVEWVVTAYMVVFASCLLAAGGLADRLGRKRMLLIGLAVFAIASLGCGIAPTVLDLNIARAIKGFGAAMLIPSALAIIAHTFNEERERAKAWAFWGTCMGIATTVAPLVGGMITQFAGWRWVFLMNLPICAVLALCAHRFMHESKNERAPSIDKAGSALFGLALACGIGALISAGTHGWTHGSTLMQAAISVLLFVLFVGVERRTRHPMIDLSLFANRRLVGAVLAMVGFAACAQVMMTFLPLYLQNAYGLPAVAAGVRMLPFAVAMIVGPYIGDRLSHRLTIASILVIGLIVIGTGNLVTGAVVGHGTYAWVAIGMIITGCGAGIMNGNTQKAIIALVEPSRAGMASGISTTSRFTAIVVSVGVLGSVLAVQTRRAIDVGAAAHPAMASLINSRFTSHVLAGDSIAVIAEAPQALRPMLLTLARHCFASGFSDAVYVSGAVALTLAICTWVLMVRESIPQPGCPM